MTKQDPGIAREIVSTVAAVLVELGYRPAEQLKSAQEPVVAGEVADESLAAAAAALGTHALAVRVAKRIPVGGLGLLDYSLSTSSDLREGLRRLARHYGLATQRVTLRLSEVDGQAVLVFERPGRTARSRLWVEFASAMVAERLRQVVGPEMRYSEVCFVHSAPPVTAEHEAHFGVPLSWAAAQDSLSFPAALLDAPLRTAASALATVLEARIKEVEPTLAASDTFLDRARRGMAELLDKEDARLESLVSRLGISRRTLQRELATRGTSHRAMLDEVRRGRARQLLEGNTLTVTEVAFRLGFSDQSAFFRAFRRWTGRSPRSGLGGL